MIRPPPGSTLFPYTTLFRSLRSATSSREKCRRHRHGGRARRSEEHTSELQSPCNLVCRLLLEKKNDVARLFINDHKKDSKNAEACNATHEKQHHIQDAGFHL